MRLTEEETNIYDGYPMVTVVTKEIVYTTDQDQHLARRGEKSVSPLIRCWHLFHGLYRGQRYDK